jgi:hypothetical protein
MPVDELASLHVTVTIPVPGFVRVPISHDHDARPLASAFKGTKPCATLAVPAGVT